MSTVTINGVELSLDLLDADVMERYESLIRKVSTDVQEPAQYKGLSASDGMRIQCRHIDKFFDALFGNGTALELFGGGSNLGIRLDAFAQVAGMSRNAQEDIFDMTGKYGLNRINRRHGKQKPKYKNHGYRGK